MTAEKTLSVCGCSGYCGGADPKEPAIDEPAMVGHLYHSEFDNHLGLHLNRLAVGKGDIPVLHGIQSRLA